MASRCLLYLSFVLFVLVVSEDIVLSQENALFRYLEISATSLDAGQTELLTAIQNRVTTAQVHLVRLAELSEVKNRHSLLLNLPGKINLSGHLRNVEIRTEDNFTWRGYGNDNEEHVVLTVHGQNLNGLVHLKSGLITIEPLGDELHAVVEIDQSKFPPDDESTHSHGRRQSANTSSLMTHNASPELKSSLATSVSTNPIIDVMVAYTPAAAASVGDIHNLIQNSIDVTNTTLANTNISASISGVYQVQVNYTESGSLETDVDRLQNPSDGYIDDIHAMRSQHGADIVVLLVASGDYGGFAFNIEVDAAGAL